MAKQKTEIIYGIHAVESALKHGIENVFQVWVAKGRNDKRIQQIVNLARKNNISLEVQSPEIISKRCKQASHQGVVANVRISNTSSVSLEEILERDHLLILVLDEVQDPHNIGACLRTADAAGVDAVLVSKNRSPGLTPVVRKVASGAAETVPFIQVSNLARAIQQLRDNDVWVIGTTGESDTAIYDLSVGKRMAIVMGSEGKGMRRLTRESCDELVSIPLAGSVESLNVSVATGICLYEVKRKLGEKT